MFRKSNTYLGLFLIFSLGNLAALATPTPSDNLLTKPFLMILLGAYAYARLKPIVAATAKWLLLGLGFAFAGDTLLLFADGRPAGSLFFLLGLGSFLLTHVAYWIAFHYWPGRKRGLLSVRPLLVLPFLLYWGLVLWLLWPLPAGMQVPVLIYSGVIMLMAAKALHIRPRLWGGNHLMLMTGAVLFILSDTIIALSRFTNHLELPAVVIGWLIMVTYLSGQLLIVMSVARSLAGEKP